MKKTLGSKIFEYRKELGITQEEISEKLGVSPQAVSKWENDVSCPDISLLPEIAKLFDTTIDELLSDEPKQKAMLVPQENRKNPDDLVLRIIIRDGGDNVNVNFPLPLIKALIASGADLGNISGNKLNNINIEQLLSFVDNGVIGTLLEITESDGTTVRIVVE